MKVAHFWSDNIQIHMLYSCLHIHVTILIPALDIPKMDENKPQSLTQSSVYLNCRDAEDDGVYVWRKTYESYFCELHSATKNQSSGS